MTDKDRELEILRHKMNDITAKMVNLFFERIKIASNIGNLKKDMGRDIIDITRESQLRQNILQICKEQQSSKIIKECTTQQAEQLVTKFVDYLINESTIIQSASVQSASVQSASVQSASVQSASVQSASVQSASVQSASVQSASVQSASVQSASVQSASVQSAKNKNAKYDNITTTHLSIFAKAKEIEKTGRDIIHMEVGEPNFAPPHIIRDALVNSYDSGHTKYGNPQGMPELLNALATHASKRYKVAKKLSAKNIIVTPGGRFAVFAAMSALLEPNDEVIILKPAWPAYENCATYLNTKVRTINTTIQEAWMPQTSKIHNVINGNTKMIILNYPNNPTGKILSTGIMDEIIKLAKENDTYVLSDEIYADYTIASKPQKSVMSYKYDKCIAIQSFSKSHAMTGFRIGYAMASDHSIIDKIKSLSALCLTSVATPMQYAALQALDTDTTQNVKLIHSRLKILVQKMQEANLEFVKPDGGMYLFVRMPSNVIGGNTVAFSHELLEKHGVAVAPGVGFGPSYSNYIRISVACEDIQRLTEGTDRLMSMLN